MAQTASAPSSAAPRTIARGSLFASLLALLRRTKPQDLIRNLLLGGFTVALLVVAGVVLLFGLPFYLTPAAERVSHPLYATYASGRPIGLLLGIVGSALMVFLLMYSARKWLRFLSFMGTSRTWMTFHFVCGMIGPLFIALHAEMKWPTGFIGVGFWCMVFVSFSGVFGRHLFGYFPQSAENAQQDLTARSKELAEVRTQLVALTDGKSADQVARAVSLAMDLELEPRTLGELIVLDAEARHRVDVIRILLYRARLPAAVRERAERALVQQLGLRQRRAGFDVARRLLRFWNLFHQPLAFAMYLIALVHILNAIVFGGSLTVLFGGE